MNNAEHKGTCPNCGEGATFAVMDDDEFFGTDPPGPDPVGDGIWWVCTWCGAYPEGGVVQVPTYEEES